MALLDLVRPKSARAKLEDAQAKAHADRQTAQGEKQRAAHAWSLEDTPKTTAALADAEARVAAAERRVQLAEAALREQSVIDAKEASAATVKIETAQDRKSRAVFKRAAEAATAMEAATAAYVRSYEHLMAVAKEAELELAANPRVRPDIRGLNVAGLVADELARVSTTADEFSNGYVPGANIIHTQTSDRRTWPSIGQAIASTLAAAAGVLRT